MITAPFAKTGVEQVVSMRKLPLAVCRRTSRLHIVWPTTEVGIANYDTTLRKGISLKNSLRITQLARPMIVSRTRLLSLDALALLLIRQSRGSAADEIALWLCRTCSGARARKCESHRRILVGSKSHQPFRPIHHLGSGWPKNRLDGDGRILSVSSSWIPFARRRCVRGGSRSCRPKDDPDRNRTAESGTRRRSFSRGRDSRWRTLAARGRAAPARCIDTRAYGARTDFAMRDPWQRSSLFDKTLRSEEHTSELQSPM